MLQIQRASARWRALACLHLRAPASLLELTKLIQILLKGDGFDVNLQAVALTAAAVPRLSLLSLPCVEEMGILLLAESWSCCPSNGVHESIRE